MEPEAVLRIEIPQLKVFKRGKVRDIFDVNDHYIIAATDRISAFDSIMPNGIPDKGKILTQLSVFWFNFTNHLVPNHLVSADIKDYPNSYQKEVLSGRSMLVKKTRVLPIECVVRGYLSGSGWSDYQKTGAISGIKLPSGLKESDKLPEPIFTPTSKADFGHDMPITMQGVTDKVGKTAAEFVREKTLAVYQAAADYALSRGIIIADTKFEFGQLPDESIILIDEILTPDSSRFWPADKYQAGRSQPSYDKQFVRDYLLSIKWNKEPPAPPLPPEVVKKTRDKYLEAYKRLTGKEVL
ncbi:MAG: phosphoribosylaminoimidazolesuccinocarboxamide synthase [Candidatus Margulisiibacteriota bacterium]